MIAADTVVMEFFAKVNFWRFAAAGRKSGIATNLLSPNDTCTNRVRAERSSSGMLSILLCCKVRMVLSVGISLGKAVNRERADEYACICTVKPLVKSTNAMINGH